jgi:hypothetical protein
LAQWLWIADTLRFKPEWCWMGAGIQDIGWLKAAYPETAFIRDSTWARRVLVVFCDGRPPAWVYRIRTLELLFHPKLQRRPRKGW